MLLCTNDGPYEPSPEEIAASPEMKEWLRYVEQERGISHVGVRLRPPAEAVTVRVRDGRRTVTDGPFAETKEQIAGYEIVECADLDEAVDLAARHPTTIECAVEVRPFWPLEVPA
jgi:hypothetical protein